MRRIWWLMPALVVLTLLYPQGAWAQWLAALALAALCCVGGLGEVASAYVFLFLFDNMLPFPPLGGSLARVLQAGIVIRATLCCVGARDWPDRFVWIASALAALYCGISFFVKGLMADSVSFAVNFLVLLALRQWARSQAQTDGAAAKALLPRLVGAYIASALTAVCFGVVYNRFYVLSASEGTPLIVRFLGTHEPNFMAMFLDIAILLLLALPGETALRYAGEPKRAGGAQQGAFARRVHDLRNSVWAVRVLEALALGALLGGLVLTGSLTGMAIAGGMVVICGFALCMRRTGGKMDRARRWGMFAARLLCAGMVAVAVVAGGTMLARSHQQKVSDIYAIEDATGVAKADEPAYLPVAEYRALRAANQPLAPHMLNAAQWDEYRQAHGIEPVVPLLSEAEPLLQDTLAQALRHIPAVGERLYTVLGFARHYGLDVATSGRWGLIMEKLRDFAAGPLWQKLLGRGPDPEKTYFPMFSSFGYSHNSYLDMLTGFGILGFAGVLWWFVRTLRRGRLFGMPVQGPYRLALTLVRVALLLHAATLSMHLNRVFLFFFMG